MLDNNIQRVSLIFYWMLTTAVGGLVLALAIPAAADGIQQGVIPGTDWGILLIAALVGAAAGGIVGLLQWLALRRILIQTNGWVLISILSWAAGLALGAGVFFWLIEGGVNLVALLLPAISAGIVAGVIQWLLLKRWIDGGGMWWVAAEASGWVLGLVAGLGMTGGYRELLTGSPGLFIVVPGAIFGAILGFQTGFALVVLLSYAYRSPLSEEPPAAVEDVASDTL